MKRPLYQIPPRRFTDESGKLLADVIEQDAQEAFANGIQTTNGRRYFASIDAAHEAMQRNAEYERWSIADKTQRNAEYEAKLAAAETEARKIAAEHNFNIETLTFEVERRRFGSFTTTHDGSSERQAIYRRALEVAKAEQRSHHLEAAE